MMVSVREENREEEDDGGCKSRKSTSFEDFHLALSSSNSHEAQYISSSPEVLGNFKWKIRPQKSFQGKANVK